MKILVAGDMAIQERAANCQWNEKNLQKSFSHVKTLVSQCDHAVVNLESPVTDEITPILKDGPALKNPPYVFDIIKYCGFDIATLANNHLKDYGEKGVKDTMSICRVNNLKIIGAGVNLKEARKPLVLYDKQSDFHVGILNVCEHEASIAARKTAGANPLDFPNLYHDIQKLREQVDKIIVIIHGGREHYQLPTPRMKKEYKFIIDLGADCIINHHQHCFSGYELYNGKPIFYGLGNFFFDRSREQNSPWNEGLMVVLDIDRNKTEYKLYPYEQCNDDLTIKLVEFESVAPQLNHLNSIIGDDLLLEEEFNRLAVTAKLMYPFLPFGNRVARSFYYRGIMPAMISKKNKALMRNAISCETHRELILQFLNDYLYNE